MISKPVAIFGMVGVLCSMKKGETRESIKCYRSVNDYYMYDVGHYYFFNGTMSRKVIRTNEILPNVSARTVKLSELNRLDSFTENIREDILHTAIEDVEWLCLPHSLNIKSIYNICEFIVPRIPTLIAPSKKLYLVKGSMLAGIKKFIGPCQVHINDSVMLNELTECYCIELHKNDTCIP